MIGGGDFHQSSISPSFSDSISFCVPPRRPGFALKRKETTTAWWLAAVRIIKRGDRCLHHGGGAVVYVAKVQYGTYKLTIFFKD